MRIQYAPKASTSIGAKLPQVGSRRTGIEIMPCTNAVHVGIYASRQCPNSTDLFVKDSAGREEKPDEVESLKLDQHGMRSHVGESVKQSHRKVV